MTDSAACCAEGLEFRSTDDYVFPDDYPKTGSEICITGVFDVHLDGNFYDCVLVDAQLQ